MEVPSKLLISKFGCRLTFVQSTPLDHPREVVRRSDSALEGDETRGSSLWVHRVRGSGAGPEGAKMRESVMWVMLVPDKGATEAKFTVEQGYAIMLGKPIIAMA